MLYNGSLKDVRTLTTSLETAFHIGQRRLTLVMDKGFYSKNNLHFLFKSPIKAKFLMAVPFTVGTARRLVEAFKPHIEKARYAVALGRRESIQGAMKTIRWDGGEPVYAHVYFNMVKAGEVKNSIYGYAASLRDLAVLNPLDSRYEHEFKEYLNITRQGKTGQYRITVRHEAVEAEYAHAGWMVLISNRVKDPGEALKIYRAKDAVEKGFFRLKHDLDFHRLRIHGDARKSIYRFYSAYTHESYSFGNDQPGAVHDMDVKGINTSTGEAAYSAHFGKQNTLPGNQNSKRNIPNF
jgi:transposase